MHTCVGVTLITHWSHSTLLRVCVCALRVTRVHVYVQSARVQRSLCLCLFSFFTDGDSVCVTMSRRNSNTARTQSLRDSDTHLPVRFAISPRSGAVGSRGP